MFTLDGPASHYTIHLTPLSGNLPDTMSNHTGMMFSTKDKDNDNLEESSCARIYSGSNTKNLWISRCLSCVQLIFQPTVFEYYSNLSFLFSGGWWFNACGGTNLNGRYSWMRSRNRAPRRKGIYWRPNKGSSYTVKFTKISIRPLSQFQWTWLIRQLVTNQNAHTGSNDSCPHERPFSPTLSQNEPTCPRSMMQQEQLINLSSSFKCQVQMLHVSSCYSLLLFDLLRKLFGENANRAECTSGVLTVAYLTLIMLQFGKYKLFLLLYTKHRQKSN